MANSSDYWERRENLIREDRALRVDASKTSNNLTLIENKADAIVRKIRAVEAQKIWNAGINDGPLSDASNIFPGMEFLTARDTILQTDLFKIISKMPKGGLLHAHLDATVNSKVLLELALQQPAMHVRVDRPINVDNIESILPQFLPLPKAQFSALLSITDGSYTPGLWVSMRNARASFDPLLGGPEGFDSWVIDSMTINPTEAYGTHNNAWKIWDKFQSTFMVSEGLIHFVPIWEQYLREFFMSSVDDGISYVEPRIMFSHKYILGVDGEEKIYHRGWLLIIERVISQVKDELKAQGREGEFIGARIIYSVMRDIGPNELDSSTEDCLALKKEFPHLIAGFDLVGREDALNPLIDYIEPFGRFVKRQKEEGVKIPFIFHAGETLGDGSKADMNLYDAILLGTKRIGHGFSLVKHPKLMEICKEKDIAVEVCPISNELLRLAGSMPMHPLPTLMNQGVHVALCSDDPAVFGNMGLSFDFFQVLVASEVTGLLTLGEIAKDSLKYSTLEEPDKQRALGLWKKRWTKFLEDIVVDWEEKVSLA